MKTVTSYFSAGRENLIGGKVVMLREGGGLRGQGTRSQCPGGRRDPSEDSAPAGTGRTATTSGGRGGPWGACRYPGGCRS